LARAFFSFCSTFFLFSNSFIFQQRGETVRNQRRHCLSDGGAVMLNGVVVAAAEVILKRSSGAAAGQQLCEGTAAMSERRRGVRLQRRDGGGDAWALQRGCGACDEDRNGGAGQVR
jgi:hypothetical protein